VSRRKEAIPWAYVLRGIRLSVRVYPDSYVKRVYTWGERMHANYAVMSLLLMTVFLFLLEENSLAESRFKAEFIY
jgi:hypothetical protein